MHRPSFRISILCLCLTALGAVAADWRARLANAADLCQAGDHEGAIAAYTALAETRDAPAEQFDALSAAARCARLHLRDEARAFALCDLLEDEVWRLGCRAVIHQWAGSPDPVLEDLGDVDLLGWPDALAATAFRVRGQAHYRKGHAQEAVDDFVHAYQFSGGREKWGTLKQLGDTFRHLMDDEILAEACYRQAMTHGGMGWGGLQARVSLGDLLLEQQRYDDALRVYSARPDGSWRTPMFLGAARAHQGAGDTEAALAVLDALREWPHVSAAQRAEAETIHATLTGEDGTAID